MSDEPQAEKGITRISVRGYKSLHDESSIEIRPLTILAGANSSGKSSIMQPLLMMKQTLEAPYDPGPLMIDGPNVRFTSAQQFLSRIGDKNVQEFSITVEIDNSQSVTNTFKKPLRRDFELVHMVVRNDAKTVILRPNMSQKELEPILPIGFKKFSEQTKGKVDWRWKVGRSKCFLEFQLYNKEMETIQLQVGPSGSLRPNILKIIHVPGLRGNPERTYKTTAVGSEFPGTFENYVASIVSYWQLCKDKRLVDLGTGLKILGLSWKVEAKQLNDTQVELRIGRLLNNLKDPTQDMVSIADVGLGVSQVLPVIVALLVAEPEQLVYIEQPEIHLHPKAQAALAQLLADAANRGVRVVVETHSSLLLLGIQALVAEGKLAPNKVKLHWFKRRDDGSTEISSADLDEAGAFGDWPEDFDDIELKLQSRYLDASEAQLLKP